MSCGRGSVVRWVRTIHRWLSLAFTVVAIVALVGPMAGLPESATGPIATAAVVLIVLLLASGLWVAIHHYTLKFRRNRAVGPVRSAAA